ncbi:3-hydroxybutyryl-CoA dehydrogenase [Vampirovibrio chlorellavorus]|uniref:3-hydroxybutyryl-CoA dehydrogenase n=1 Tax=Vampirovibrio chlorellavorus TaxID=758823 RepID=UPI0026F0753D|nr:3-hydroxybutyryl-CoA dehydrogenase [Vampirovibrio chlorellavorus]
MLDTCQVTESATVAGKSASLQTVGVVGAGQMGNGIAQVMAHHAGLSVVVQDVNTAALEKALAIIEKSLSKFVEKAQISGEQKAEILGRIRFETALEALKDADLVVEAIVEKEAIKREIFLTLDSLTKPTAILASNTSSISITRLAAATQRPAQVIGMHFMNPVPLMKLVEIIRGAQTSDATYAVVADLTARLNKTGVVSRDFPGFISNRVLMPLINEAIFTLYEGIASAEDIDTVLKLGMNHPMGPLTLADFIGLDTCLAIMNVLHDGFQDPRFRPCPLLKQYVDAGYLGRKSGRGFFSYS